MLKQVNCLCLILFLFFIFSCNEEKVKSINYIKESVAEKDVNLSVEKANTHVYGIDISHHQHNEIDSIVTKNHDLDFIICKATEGETYIDPQFSKNWKMLNDHNVIRGAYHFFRSKDDPVVQASFFLKTIADINPTDIPPIIDFEEGGIDNSQSIEKIQYSLLSFINYVEEQSNRKPIIYTNLNVGNKYLNNPVFSDYKLWIANYTKANNPNLPKVWKTKGWSIWQKTDKYEIFSQKNDFDIFNGNKSDFEDFIRKSNI